MNKLKTNLSSDKEYKGSWDQDIIPKLPGKKSDRWNLEE
jgi:hypothetical protein